LPAGWRFFSQAELDAAEMVPSEEFFAARPTGSDAPIAIISATDLVSRYSWEGSGRTEREVEALKAHARKLLREAGVEGVAADRASMDGLELEEASGTLDDLRVTVRVGYRGNRRFTFQCFEMLKGPKWSCAPAFASVQISDPPDPPPDQKRPRVLHLREERFGLSFDAPDDSWLAMGPRTGQRGRQVLWFWYKDGRQIDVQVFDLTGSKTPIDEAAIVKMMSADLEADGATVQVGKSTLAGKPCHHVEVRHASGRHWDLFVLIHGTTNYSILIGQPTREPRLVDLARKGFQLTDK
jgi:hypothetical protein